jgi:hypothetical protein
LKKKAEERIPNFLFFIADGFGSVRQMAVIFLVLSSPFNDEYADTPRDALTIRARLGGAVITRTT